MKAARFHQTGAPEVLRIEDVPTPAAGPGQVLLRVEAAGLNFADTIRRAGKYYPMPTPLPHVSGTEAVGVVEAVGDGVGSEWIGRRVFADADGAFAEYLAAPAEKVFAAPEGIEPEQGAAMFVQGLTAALLLKLGAGIKRGQSVFVEGAAGGVGSLLVQLAKLYGAGKVIAGASSEAKRRLAIDLGADAAVNYREPGWSQRVLDETGGAGVDYVFNMSGQKAFDEGLKGLAFRGRMIVFGGAEGGPPSVHIGQLFGKAQGVQAFVLGFFIRDRALIESTLAELAGFVREGKLKLNISGVFPLEQAAEAHRLLESGGSTGKLVVTLKRGGPVVAAAPLLIAEQGAFWVGVERRATPDGVFAAGQTYVQYQIPAERKHAFPLVMVHGGGGQGSDYLATPDGRPGWATFFLREGYAVYVVDRPLHGRSPLRPEAGGQPAPPPSYDLISALFTAPAKAARYPRAALHTQWPGSGEPGDPALDQLIAGMGAMPDFATAEADMRRSATALLDRIGPSILMVHSAGGPFAWHGADARPELVKAILALEVIGPPFSTHPFGALAWGVTATPLTFDPPYADAQALQTAATSPGALAPRLANLSAAPILVVTAEASWVSEFDAETFNFLLRCGAPAQHLRLEDAGIRGNGHMMMAEANSDEVAAALAAWLANKGL